MRQPTAQQSFQARGYLKVQESFIAEIPQAAAILRVQVIQGGGKAGFKTGVVTRHESAVQALVHGCQGVLHPQEVTINIGLLMELTSHVAV